ncbi:hypothetical protein Y032_0638g972 [Ancylostoma ceylanicum]|uniref:Uncharacterized protein n=1 Tax=Ancylostoma ceylanicum TaxID=53326 RepID=A0A016WJN6_9BILA|nr:hypothetical protein Y032_0638g972 [Ancylostoma ceylanicum]
MQGNFLNWLRARAYLRIGLSQIRAFSEYYAAEEIFLPRGTRCSRRVRRKNTVHIATNKLDNDKYDKQLQHPEQLSGRGQTAAAAKARLEITKIEEQLQGLSKEAPPSSSAGIPHDDAPLPRFPRPSQRGVCKFACWSTDHQFATECTVYRTLS